MNYLDYYELAQEPFSNAPVSRFYFNSPQHAQALVRLTHVCSQMKGLAILVGDIGASKTTLARAFKETGPVSGGMFESGPAAYNRPSPGNTWTPSDTSLKGQWLHTKEWGERGAGRDPAFGRGVGRWGSRLSAEQGGEAARSFSDVRGVQLSARSASGAARIRGAVSSGAGQGSAELLAQASLRPGRSSRAR